MSITEQVPLTSHTASSHVDAGQGVHEVGPQPKAGSLSETHCPLHSFSSTAQPPSEPAPPPRFALTRFAGVFAPSSPWRGEVVAYGRGAASTKCGVVNETRVKKRKKNGAANVDPVPAPTPARTALGAGIVKAVGARIDWASLLRRVSLSDVLACPCGGRRRVVANIDDAAAVAALLLHLGLPTEPPPVAPARSPTFDAA